MEGKKKSLTGPPRVAPTNVAPVQHDLVSCILETI